VIAGMGDAFRIGEVKDRVLFTLAMLALFRLGVHIPLPGVDPKALTHMIGGGGVLGFLDLFVGGALRRFSIFALGVAPYINASIIMQLLIYVVPALEKMSKDEEGRRKINVYTRYATVAVAAIQALGITFMLKNAPGVLLPEMQERFAYFAILSVVTLTAGTMFLMWLGDQITEFGIGNGISVLIFGGIVARMPEAAVQTWRAFSGDASAIPKLVIVLLLMIAVVAGVVMIQEGVRKIPVRYGRRISGRRVYGGHSTYLPIRVNMGGVIPIIFAISVLMFPNMVGGFIQKAAGGKVATYLGQILAWFRPGHVVYYVLYALLIIFFTFFYASIIFNPDEIAENLRKYGGMIAGRRPGKNTAEYIDRVATRITFAGAIFLAIIALIPHMLRMFAKVPFYFGGTALLIVVGVALDIVKQMEAHVIMRYYEGALGKGRLL